MTQTRRYEFDGMTLNIPIHYDEQVKMYIEDYPDFIGNPTWTPSGYRVLFSGTDACTLAQERTPGGCLDCGGCQHFHRLADHTWVGVCRHPQHRK